MRLPDYPIPTEPIRASWGRQVIDYLRSITPRSSPDLLVKTTANGTTFEPTAKSGSGGNGGIDYDYAYVGGIEYMPGPNPEGYGFLQINADGSSAWIPAMISPMPAGSEIYNVRKNHIHLPGESAGNI